MTASLRQFSRSTVGCQPLTLPLSSSKKSVTAAEVVKSAQLGELRDVNWMATRSYNTLAFPFSTGLACPQPALEASSIESEET